MLKSPSASASAGQPGSPHRRRVSLSTSPIEIQRQQQAQRQIDFENTQRRRRQREDDGDLEEEASNHAKLAELEQDNTQDDAPSQAGRMSKTKNDPMADLEQSMAALRFVPTSVKLRQERARGKKS